jgi:hypothetical protein
MRHTERSRLLQAPMLPDAMERKLRETSANLRRHKRGHALRLQERLNGEYGADVRPVIQVLKAGADEMALLQTLEPLRSAPVDVRTDILIWVGSALGRARLQKGEPPFSDCLDDGPPSTFQRARRLLTTGRQTQQV